MRAFLLLLLLVALAGVACAREGAPPPVDPGGAGGGGSGGTGGSIEPECGDGVAEGGEICDGEDLRGASCAAQGFDGGTLGCSPDCSLDLAACTREEVCTGGADEDGDGLADCDDPDCAGHEACPACGDGILDVDEECDGDFIPASCADVDLPFGEVACTDECTFDYSGCKPPEDCASPGDEDGDGLADCDDPDCAEEWHCPICGNNVLQQGEDCDRFLVPVSCTELGMDTGVPTCTEACTLDTSTCRNVTCGDGFVDPPEQCEPGHAPPGYSCNEDCSFVGDDCSAPMELNLLWNVAEGAWRWAGETTALRADFDVACLNVAGQRDAVASFVAPAAGEYVFRLEADFLSVVWIWEGACADGAPALACETIAPPSAGTYETVLELEEGELVHVALSGRQLGSLPIDRSGAFTLDVIPAICGDRRVSGSETCDDGNDDEHDGCTTSCTPSGNDCSTTHDLLGHWIPTLGSWLFQTTIDSFDDGISLSCGAPGAPEIVTRFTAWQAGAYQVLVTSGAADLAVSIRDETCDGPTAERACVDDETGGKEGVIVDLQEAETIHVVAEPRAPFVDPEVVIEVRPLACGDGHVTIDEECDDGDTVDGDGCAADCTWELVCGDGIHIGPEECDDGDTVDGDGCSALCLFEGAPELEPNDTLPLANPLQPTALVPTRFVGKGSVEYSDVDVWSFPAVAGGMYSFQTRIPGLGDGCELDHRLRLLDPAGNVLASTDVPCGAFNGFFSQVDGAHYIEIRPQTSSQRPDYHLQVEQVVWESEDAEVAPGAP